MSWNEVASIFFRNVHIQNLVKERVNDIIHVDCDGVSLYCLLGSLVEHQFSFVPLLRESIASLKASFSEFVHAGERSGYSIPVMQVNAVNLYMQVNAVEFVHAGLPPRWTSPDLRRPLAGDSGSIKMRLEEVEDAEDDYRGGTYQGD